ncbi:MAG: ATP-dependent Clp protease proteolytic subunit [Minisyncoccia bacterium]
MDIINNVIAQLQQQANQILGQFRQLRGNASMEIQLSPIDRKGVDAVFDIINNPQFQMLRQQYPNPNNIDIIVDSPGGDADAAYHIAKLIHSHFSGTITYVIPRFAKSAATLMVCGGNKIVMGETSELGPLDPQIRQDGGNYISAKAVQSTLDLIKEHLQSKDKRGLELATILVSRMNPLVLGQYQSTLDIAKEYQKELLMLRMYSSKKDVNKIVQKFAVGYTHHSRIIDCREAQQIFGTTNLEVWPSNSPLWQSVWQYYEVNRSIKDLIGILQIMNRMNNN